MAKKNALRAAQAVANRLTQMRRHWEDAAQNYFSPKEFILAVQSCITVSRTVTFILQSNKAEFEGFEEWYSGYRSRWSNDGVMLWARDARNKIEKQGDLATASQLRLEIVASYLGGPETDWLRAPIFSAPRDILNHIPKNYLTKHVIENGTLLIERRWVDVELPAIELLEALHRVYLNLSEMLNDLCNYAGIPLLLSRNEIDPHTMSELAMDRAIYVSLLDGTLRGHRIQTMRLPRSEKVLRSLEKRYRKIDWQKRLGASSSVHEIANVFFEQGKLMMLRDGYHLNFAFFIKDANVINIIANPMPDRASKYVMVRDLAKLARIQGVDTVIMIGEAWTAFGDDIPKSGFAEDAKNRGEALVMNVASNTGDVFSLSAAVNRSKIPFSKIITSLGETKSDSQFSFMMAPFLHQWGCLNKEQLAQALKQVDEMGIEIPGGHRLNKQAGIDDTP